LSLWRLIAVARRKPTSTAEGAEDAEFSDIISIVLFKDSIVDFTNLN